MRCPVCEETLQMTDRQGVEIDYCPKCRGVWLDRGELQKLIDLSVAQVEASHVRSEVPRSEVPRSEVPRSEPRVAYEYGRPHVPEPRYEAQRPDPYYNGYGKPKKRESWLGELFDWD